MPKARAARVSIPIERLRLDNGLRVVLSPDRSSSAVMVAAYYDVGFRSEPPGRTGFAHLFEHLMFEGSATLPKGKHDELTMGNGGLNNGSTRNDFTNYFELMPTHALELTLFLEADRMRGLRLTEENLRNQTDVVKEEVKVNVLNQPYGGFPWLWLPMALFETFPNAHNGYGEFEDLEAATLDDAAAFFDRYYAPGNCVLAVVGGFDVDECARLVERHFAGIPARAVPALGDFAEPVPSSERRMERVDPNAPEPAVAVGYRIPDPIREPEAYAAAVLCSAVLTGGEASRLYQRLVKDSRLATHVGGEVGLVAGEFEVRDPSMLQVVAYYQGTPNPDPVLAAIDEEVARVAERLPKEELDRVRNGYLADFLGGLDSLINRGMLIAALEQQRGRAEVLNELPGLLAGVSAAEVSAIASDWLKPGSRGVLSLAPGRGK